MSTEIKKIKKIFDKEFEKIKKKLLEVDDNKENNNKINQIIDFFDQKILLDENGKERKKSAYLNGVLNMSKINDPRTTLYAMSTFKDFLLSYFQEKTFLSISDKKKYFDTNVGKITLDFLNKINGILEEKTQKKKEDNKDNSVKDDYTLFGLSYKLFMNANDKKFLTNNNINRTKEKLEKVSFENAMYYLIKLYTIQTINGYIGELEVGEKMGEILLKNNISDKVELYDKITGYEDNHYCVDIGLLKIKEKNNKVAKENKKDFILGLQVKPLSFYVSLIGYGNTVNSSFNKISKANDDENNYLKGEKGIFIVFKVDKSIKGYIKKEGKVIEHPLEKGEYYCFSVEEATQFKTIPVYKLDSLGISISKMYSDKK